MNRCSTVKILFFLSIMLGSPYSFAIETEPLSADKAQEQQWISLFNGQNLDGWIAKFADVPLGINHKNTFVVKDGLLSVDYTNWDEFDGKFGHLFYEVPFSRYVIQARYRFIGQQLNGAPGWAYKNNGLMLHAQDPKTMTFEQSFPTSIEIQLLGGNGKDQRNTANICTPESSVIFKNERSNEHCINSDSPTYHGEQWVDVEITVDGQHSFVHKVNGKQVMQHNDLQLDNNASQHLVDFYQGRLMKQGFIAIQAETHPTQFAYIRVKPF